MRQSKKRESENNREKVNYEVLHLLNLKLQAEFGHSESWLQGSPLAFKG